MSPKAAKKPKAFDEREQLALAKALRGKRKPKACADCGKAPCECTDEPDEAEE